jgi:hypothetical protein
MLTPSARGEGDGLLATRAIAVCGECGAAHESASRETCHACGAALGDAHLIRDVFRIENVETIPAERISINDEERQRIGFDLQTLFAWASRSGRIDARKALVSESGEQLLELSYGAGATITRVNKGLRRRRNQSDLGFVIDPRTGWWAKSEGDEDNDSDNDANGVATRQKVVPAVEESKNALLLRRAPAFGTLAESEMTTLEHALLRGIETVFQLENGEILGEPLPTRSEHRTTLLYEASEGGAGVLSRIATEPDALARVAREALHIMHFDPPADLVGVTVDTLPAKDVPCVAGCYRCLLSYYNQPDHEVIDRRAATVKTALLRLARSVTAPAVIARVTAATEPSAPGTKGVQEWRATIVDRGLDVPDFAPSIFNGSSNVLLWSDYFAAASLGPVPEPDRDKLRQSGVDLIEFPESRETWSESLDRLSNLLRG